MRAPRVFLGLSLPTMAAGPGEEDAIIDFWEGGSLLYGSDFMGSCIDYFPMLSLREEIGCLKRLCDNINEINFDEEVIGDINDISSKLTLEPTVIQKNWLLTGPRKGLLPKGGWCRCYRKHLLTLKAKKLVGLGIASVDLEQHQVVTYLKREIISSDEIVSTMPLPYILTKSGYSISESDFPYEPLHIALFLLKGHVVKEPKRIVLAKLRYGGIVIYVIPDKPFRGITSIYHVSSARKLRFSGLQERAFSDVKKIGLIASLDNVIGERHIMIKYGLLGKISDSAEDAVRDAKEKGLRTLGRLGRWREMSVCESYLDGLNYCVGTD